MALTGTSDYYEKLKGKVWRRGEGEGGTVRYNRLCSLVIIPLKKGIMFFTYITRFVCLCVCVCVCLCVCVCVSVCHHVCGEMAGLSNMVSSEVNTIYKNLKMQH